MGLRAKATTPAIIVLAYHGARIASGEIMRVDFAHERLRQRFQFVKHRRMAGCFALLHSTGLVMLCAMLPVSTLNRDVVMAGGFSRYGSMAFLARCEINGARDWQGKVLGLPRSEGINYFTQRN